MVYGSFFKIYQTITILTDSCLRHPHGQLNYLKLLKSFRYDSIFRCKDNIKDSSKQAFSTLFYKL